MAPLQTGFYLVLSLIFFCNQVSAVGKVVCFYDSKAYWRKDLAKVTPEELKPALTACTHLIYGYVGIDKEHYEVKSLDKRLDLDTKEQKDKREGNFRRFTDLKKQFPYVKYLLSVGGFHDEDDSLEKYWKVLEKTERRAKFITSLAQLVREYNFDGADLAWQFPLVKEKKEHSTLGSIWSSIKSAVSSTPKDEHVKEHKEQFTALVRELSAALKGNKAILTLSVMPHVHKEAYFDGPGIKDSVEHIHLMTYDFKTPDRNDELADYAAPLEHSGSRNSSYTISENINWWLKEKFPSQKLLIAVPTFGRTWKLPSDTKSANPPLKADGHGEEGAYSKQKGIMGYYEICPTLTTDSRAASTLLKKVTDPTNRLGTYAYRLPASKVKGLWVSYEDPEVAAKKAYYSKQKALGGVAVVDLSLDDFKGSCPGTSTKFPILSSVKLNV